MKGVRVRPDLSNNTNVQPSYRISASFSLQKFLDHCTVGFWQSDLNEKPRSTCLLSPCKFSGPNSFRLIYCRIYTTGCQLAVYTPYPLTSYLKTTGRVV